MSFNSVMREKRKTISLQNAHCREQEGLEKKENPPKMGFFLSSELLKFLAKNGENAQKDKEVLAKETARNAKQQGQED